MILPPLRDVVRRHGLDARRSLGQHFLFDLNLTGRIARAAGPLAGVTIVEIGPGPGGLTRALLAEGAPRVVAIERDERFMPPLAELGAAYPDRLEVIAADALSFDYGRFAGAGPVRVVANLPYNIGTELLAGWLSSEPWPPWFESLTLMFQREVAERIVATPRTPADYGRLAVLTGWRADSRILFEVPAAAFTPPPKVASAVVQLFPRRVPAPCAPAELSRVTAAAFGQRRKMLRQSLKSLHPAPADLLRPLGIDPTRRAETLAVEDFVRIANALA